MRNGLIELASAMVFVLVAGCGEPGRKDAQPNPDLKTPDVPPGRTSGVPKEPGKK